MNEDRKILKENQKIGYYEDEIELMDYLLVIWKWKYVIIAGTLAFGFVAGLISFIAFKQQSTIYRTSIILKPGLLKIDETGNKAFIDSPENIKALIENDLKHKIIDDIKNYRGTKFSNLSEFHIDIPIGSDNINVSFESDSVEDGTTEINYLIKALSAEFADEINFIQKKIEDRIEEKKYEFEILLLKEKKMKTKIKKYEKKISDIESKIKLLKERKDVSPSREYFLNKLSVENDYLNTLQLYFKENENTMLNLFEIQRKTNKLPKEIAELEKEKQNIQIIQVVQPPITTELAKNNKIRRNLILSSVVGYFSMLFLAFFLEYLSNYKKRVSPKNCVES